MDFTRDDKAMRRMLSGDPRIAMVGASPNRDRDSNSVFRYLQRAGFDVLPVTPVAPEIEGVKTVPDLRAAARFFAPYPIDIVDVFRAPEHLPGVVDEAVAVKARAMWLQLGVVHEQAIRRALDHGLDLVVDRCIKVEHARLFR